MNAAFLAVGALACFTLAYRTYARWLERRVYDMDTDEPTPAHNTPDGVDFVPCQKHVLFGHHFCSVAGAAPIVGPAIAVIWGWLPALVWVVFGTIFIGAVHDYGALALSAKRGGRTMGDLAGEILGQRARVWFLSIIILLTWVVLAVFAWLIATLFVAYPASVIPVNFEILVALLIGWWIYRRKGALLWPSILAVVLLYVVVFWAAQPGNQSLGSLPAALHIDGSAKITWIVLLLIYAYIASVLPVRILLQPRDYINSHQLLVGLAAFLMGIALTHPEVTAPAINTSPPEGTPPLMPLLFITIACGAISGFHGLVASGTTSKQLNCMRDARQVGYGGMLGEGVLAVVAVLAVSAGLGDAAAWAERYGAWNDRPLANFVDGAASFLRPFLGDHVALAKTVVAVIVISFAATTLDTATRIQRFCLTELAVPFRLKALRNRYVSSAVAVLPAATLAIFTDGGKGPGSGGWILWPVFGTTNQLIGGLTLLTLFVYLRAKERPTLTIALPMMFLLLMTAWAGVRGLIESVRAENWVVAVFGALFLLLEALVLWEGARRLLRPDAAPSQV